jgi:aspartyl-tRNA(Asn)/glutamyl-tRNA(Gln) amidotransferase subunit C
MKLDKQEIKHIAELARLHLTDKEMETYGSQLTDILSYIDQLKEVDTTGVEPTAQVTGLKNVWREDGVKEWDQAEVKAAFKQAPELENGQVKVRRIL